MCYCPFDDAPNFINNILHVSSGYIKTCCCSHFDVKGAMHRFFLHKMLFYIFTLLPWKLHLSKHSTFDLLMQITYTYTLSTLFVYVKSVSLWICSELLVKFLRKCKMMLTYCSQSNSASLLTWNVGIPSTDVSFFLTSQALQYTPEDCWNQKKDAWKSKNIYKPRILGFHVSCQECISRLIDFSKVST